MEKDLRYIPDECWSLFKKTKSKNNSTTVRDGDRFEDLIFDLIKCMFGNEIKCKKTQKTHDGNKDIVIKDGEKSYWAECKNYNSKIDLKTLAATLVMAEIEDINAILFFCYSEINESAKRKLLCYSCTVDRTIYFYDGIVLDQLILRYKDVIFPLYFPQLSSNKNFVFQDNAQMPCYLGYIERNPFRSGNVMFEKNDISDLEELQLGELVGIHFIVINRNINEPMQVDYCLKDKGGHYFSVLNPIENVTKKAIYFKSILVNPGETIHKVIYLRYDFFSPKITIPQIYVKKSAISPTGVISSRRSRYTAYIGKNYLDILSEVKKNCLNKKRLSIATFYGSSGTGKSRLLRECSDVFLNSGYKVFSFNYSSPDSSETEGISLYSLIQELILRLYGLDEDIINQITENKLDQIPEKNQTGRLDLIRFVFENRNSLSKVNSASFVPLFEKMGSEKLLYVFDDIQTYDDDIITFLSDFIKYSKNVQRKVLCAVLFAVNTDNTYSQVVKNFVIELQNMHHDLPYNCYGKQLSGFENKGAAILFLKECLGLRKDLDLSLNNLNISLRPKYLAEFSNLLIEKNVIDYNSTEAYIADSVGFSYDAHKLLSDSLNGIIGKRWEIYCGYHQFENVRKNLLCFILFAGSINVSVGAITPEYKEEITSLYNHGFIKHEPMSCIYTFEHDSIKNFFGDFYTDWMETSINAISNQIITTTNRDIIFLCNILSLSLLSDKDIFRYLKLKLHDILRKKSDEVIVHGLMNDKYIVKDLYGFLMSILLNSRDHYGEEYVGNLYQIIYDEYDESSKKLSDDQYCNLLLGYAENQLKQKNTQLSLNIYNEVLRIKSDIRTVCTIENRRFVCGRVGGKIHQFELNWKRSVKLSNENNFYDLYIENMFDYAQSFFLYHDKTDLVLEYLCRGCDFYKEHPVKSMRGHYLYRKIQIYFIKKEKEELGKCIDDALDEVCINNDISSKLFFMIQFKIFKIMYGMIYDHDIDAIALLDELNLLQRMQSHNQMYRCFYLYSKYYLSRMEWDKSFSMYLKTFKIILENDYTEEVYLQQEFMLDDMIYNMHKYHFPIKDYDFSFFSVFSGWDKRYLRLCEGDFDTYISDAIVTGTDNKDGYLFF